MGLVHKDQAHIFVRYLKPKGKTQNMRYTPSTKIQPAGTTYLQGIGNVKGTPAGELKVGDTMLWNYGNESKVGKILKETDKTITIEEHWVSSFSGKLESGERKLLKTRIVARPISELK